MNWTRKPHAQSDYDLKAIVPEQGPIIPALESSPIPVQCVGEANSLPAMGRELDVLGVPGFLLLSDKPEGFLGHQFASSHDLLRVCRMGRLKLIILTPPC